MAQIKRKGFGQVEPNHLSGIVEGRIYAQLPVDKEELGTIIEQGRFAKYDYASGKVNLTGEGQWCLIYNEEKIYDERDYGHKNFALIDTDFVGGEIVPRLIATEVGDIFTTNTFGANTSKTAEVAGEVMDVKDKVYVDKNTGYLTVTSANAAVGGPEFQVVKVYTMPDGQPGVKLQRIK